MYDFFIIMRQNKTDFVRPYDWILPHDFKLFYKSAIHLFNRAEIDSNALLCVQTTCSSF